ncbi:AAEL008222-PA [Aedes aegypti]|uniref:AAEL008222-PA n=1 Tax=Aedes aegypti TaxID=7159 RepID=Q16ZD6_AEDAE|nr:AAEL008222-PA [Aedes aegypti]
MGLLGWLQVSLSWALVSCAVNWIHLQEIDNNINGCDSQYRQHMIDHVLRKSNPKSLPVFEPSSINVTFYLLTSSNQNTSTKLTTGDIRSLRKSSFNSSNPTRIIVHGFCNCHLSEFCVTTRQKLLEHPQQYNVITMSWPSGKWILSYWTARWRIVPASQILAKFIDFLHSDGGMKLQDLYLVGHSLGAHLSGLAGKLVTSGKVGTIVGLDPAKPEFDVGKPDERLAITDASYVEVIHTNGKRLGLYEPIGHSDFYPNGGVNQPGCLPWWFGASCAHGRAWELYAESIESKLGFWSTLCSSLDKVRDTGCRSPKAKLKMGGDPIIQKGSGILTVQTNAKAPYASCADKL